MVRVAVLTSLYPSPARPFEGVFAERRWLGMAGRGHHVEVIRPIPRGPAPFARGARARYRTMPRRTDRGGIAVHHPRYLHIPRLPVWNARGFAASGTACVHAVRPEVVVADYAWPAAAAVPRLDRLGIPTVINGRGSDIVIADGHTRLRRQLTRALQTSSGWCAVASHLVDLMDRLSGTTRHGTLIANGVDLDRFEIRDRHAARARLGQPADGALILVVGHMIPRKDPLLALRVFDHARRDLAGARIVFVGAGPLEAELREAAARLDLDELVVLHGEQSPERLADWYAAASCLLLCSRWEGRPNVVLEALACGCPALATPTDGARELLERHPELLADTREPFSLAAAVVRVVGDPPDPNELRATASRWTWEATCERLEELLGQVVRVGAGQ